MREQAGKRSTAPLQGVNQAWHAEVVDTALSLPFNIWILMNYKDYDLDVEVEVEE